MEVTLYQRDDGCIETAIRIFCTAIGDKLKTEVWSCGKKLGEFETKR